jgi:5'-nucleotidase
MRILVTNDDGVHAPGIHVLARALAAAGHDVFVAAPLDDRSGAGAAIGSAFEDGGIEVEERESLVDGVPVWGIAGPPALAVMSARLGAFGDPPEVVVSGINPGNNTGRAVLHSGTVGAALTGANFGVSGLAGLVAVSAMRWLEGQPRGTVLNVNVPNVAPSELRGVRTARLAPFGTTRSTLAASTGTRLHLELRATEEQLSEDTDTMLVLAGYVAVTCLVGVRAAPEQLAAEPIAALLSASG